jgi:hypothetical protein
MSEIADYILSQFNLTGLKPRDYTKSNGGLNSTIVGYESISSTIEGEVEHLRSADSINGLLGLPVFADMQLERADGSFLVLQTVLVDVAMTKNIVKTAVNGRVGTRKEYIADGDYSISIRGVLVGEGSNYPRGPVVDLHSILDRSETIKVVCEYLRIFGIHYLVVEGYNFPQRAGYQNSQLFEVSAISDDDEVLIERL